MLKITNTTEWKRGDVFNLDFNRQFNNILRLANQACESDLCQLTLIGDNKHWRQSTSGLFAEAFDYSKTLTEMALESNQPFYEIADIQENTRANNIDINLDNRAVRYFAATPLVLNDGSVIGTLSIMSFAPRSLCLDKQSLFQMFSKEVISLIELTLQTQGLDKEVSSLKSSSKSLPELQLLKENLHKDLDNFMSNAVHDLKAPLNAVKNVTSWLKEDIENNNNDDNDKHFAMLKNSISRMQQLLTDLRVFTKLGRVKAPNDKIDLKKLVEECGRSIHAPKTFTIQSQDCELELPREPFAFVVKQLLSNAVKHNETGAGNIQISCKNEASRYTVKVSDDGPGIPSVFHTKIFDAFAKLKSKDEVEGSGLGLSMVTKSLEPYGGYISVSSEEGSGATFTIVWPKQ